jgi:hypothetical protein
MHCTHCGAKVAKTQNFCPQCGTLQSQVKKKTSKSSSAPKCTNCGSKKLGRYLCYDCFENISPFEDYETIMLFMNELTELVPELALVDSAKTLKEATAMADHLEAKLTARLSAYHLERFFSVNEKITRARKEMIAHRLGGREDSHLSGIVAITFMIVVSGWSAIATPVFLLFTIPISFFVYFKNFIFCRNCRKFLFKKHSFLRKNILDKKYGYHTEHEEISTAIQNYDSRGKASGYSSASTYIPHNVEHVDETSEYFYGCNFCGNVWGNTRTKRFNLN